MFQLDSAARWLILIGIGLTVLGVLLLLLGKIPFLNRLGGLPGDIYLQSQDGRFSCLVPIASSILISVVLTVLINLALRLLDR